MKLSLRLGALLCCTPVAAAQVQPVATETFEYTPGPLFMQNGGTGWANDWWVGPNNTEIDVIDNAAMPSFALSDNVGNYAMNVIPNGDGYRRLDVGAHPDLNDGSDRIGTDGTILWLSFSTGLTAGSGTSHWGGISFNEQFVGEKLFIGSPWNSFGYGIDDEGPVGAPEVVIPNTDSSVPTRIVTRVDYLPGMERVRVWLNPPVPYPTGIAPDLDEMVVDHVWNELKMGSGGNNGEAFSFDDIKIEKGDPMSGFGISYCGPAVVNSSGMPAEMSAIGSNTVASNNVTLQATSMPLNSFGFFLTSQMQAFAANPGGSSGNLCLGGAIGRYQLFIQNSGSAGEISLAIDLTQTPTPTGLVAVAPGQTWNFQAWFRDTNMGMATSNFTDGLEVLFL